MLFQFYEWWNEDPRELSSFLKVTQWGLYIEVKGQNHLLKVWPWVRHFIICFWWTPKNPSATITIFSWLYLIKSSSFTHLAPMLALLYFSLVFEWICFWAVFSNLLVNLSFTRFVPYSLNCYSFIIKCRSSLLMLLFQKHIVYWYFFVNLKISLSKLHIIRLRFLLELHWLYNRETEENSSL